MEPFVMQHPEADPPEPRRGYQLYVAAYDRADDGKSRRTAKADVPVANLGQALAAQALVGRLGFRPQLEIYIGHEETLCHPEEGWEDRGGPFRFRLTLIHEGIGIEEMDHCQLKISGSTGYVAGEYSGRPYASDVADFVQQTAQ